MFRYNKKKNQQKKRSMTNTKKEKRNLLTNQCDVNMREYHKFEQKRKIDIFVLVGCFFFFFELKKKSNLIGCEEKEDKNARNKGFIKRK
jgi:hypothetical protein